MSGQDPVPKVSIILSSYNYEHYVAETIESVLAQTYHDWELIIVDDGSTDRSPDVIERYAKTYPEKIHVFYHEGRVNRGIVETCRYGLSKARGEYAAFIESDDQWFPDNLEKKVAALEKDPDVVVAHSRVEMFGEDQAIVKLKKKYNWPRFKAAGVGDSAFEAFGFLIHFNFVLTFSNFLTRRRSLESLDYKPPRGAWLDWWLVSQLSLQGRFFYVPDVCVRWRIHPRSQNFSLLSKIDDFYESFEMRKKMLGMIKKRFTERSHEIPAPMRRGILKELKSNEDNRWLQAIEVRLKWTLRKNLPLLWYEYLRNIFVNKRTHRFLSRLDSVDPVKGWVLRSDERPIQLVELYSGRQILAGMDARDPRPDIASKYPDISTASRCGFSCMLPSDWAKRPKILYWIAWQHGGRWRKIEERRLAPQRNFIERMEDLASFLLLIKEIQRRKVSIKPYRRAAPHLKILVSGLSKSGTTALYFKIKNSLHDTARCLFEPKAFTPEPDDAARPVLAKILIGGMTPSKDESFREFDRRIWIVRDPRDRVISSTLYFTYHAVFSKDPLKRKRFLKMLCQKERDPWSVSLIQIVRLRAELNGAKKDSWLDLIQQQYRKALDYHSNDAQMHMIRYEDLVDGHFGPLESYLGFKLHGKAAVEPGFKRVVRTKAYGDWRNWFTPEDVEFFRPLFSEWTQRYGYTDDWKVSSTPSINPQFGSRYVERLFAESNRRNVEKVAI